MADECPAFFARFQPQTFDIASVSRSLKIIPDEGVTPLSSHTSPITQGSALYDAFGLSEFRNFSFNSKTICFTIVRIPRIVVPKDQVLGRCLKFAAVVSDKGESIPLVVYKRLELSEEGETMVTGACTAAITLSSTMKTVMQFNTNRFVFYMDDSARAVMTANMEISSWSHQQRVRKKGSAALSKDEKYDELIRLLNEHRHDEGLLDRMLAGVKREASLATAALKRARMTRGSAPPRAPDVTGATFDVSVAANGPAPNDYSNIFDYLPALPDMNSMLDEPFINGSHH